MSATTSPEDTTTEAKVNGAKRPRNPNPNQRVITNPADVVSLVMMKLDAVNGKKDELTMAIKSLADTTKQLVRAYAEHTQVIAKLQERIKALEEK